MLSVFCDALNSWCSLDNIASLENQPLFYSKTLEILQFTEFAIRTYIHTLLIFMFFCKKNWNHPSSLMVCRLCLTDQRSPTRLSEYHLLPRYLEISFGPRYGIDARNDVYLNKYSNLTECDASVAR